MDCTCLSIYRKERLDDSFRPVFTSYEKHVIEDSPGFSIELNFRLKPTYTKFETKQLTNIFGCFPEQIITGFGEWDRIVVASHEVIGWSIIYSYGAISGTLKISTTDLNLHLFYRLHNNKLFKLLENVRATT